mmetsp:Transcript_42016/g.131622  ORF Transcript_42016/g.131622 Transcript_42016/m.131622 type:complete len:226 (-) Transcript_42016:148-825(-)
MVGCRSRNVLAAPSEGVSRPPSPSPLASPSASSTEARRFEGDIGVSSVAAPPAADAASCFVPLPKCWKMSDCFSRYCSRCSACRAMNALFSSCALSISASRASRAARCSARFAVTSAETTRGLRGAALFASAGTSCVRLRGPVTSASRSARRFACASSAAASAAALSASYRALSSAASFSNLDFSSGVSSCHRFAMAFATSPRPPPPRPSPLSLSRPCSSAWKIA